LTKRARQASAAFPENTLASFRGAILDGADGLETDVHVTSDNVVICFHDPYLERVTSGTGLVKNQPFYNGIDQVRTTKTPIQPIATFEQTIALLMQPEAKHVLLNLDIKPDNKCDLLFSLIAQTVSSYPDWETELAPRIILGLWHPKFIEPAKRLLPSCKRIHIGFSISLAKKFFWRDCSGFSINFATLATAEGKAFREDCRVAGKDVFVWTVNARNEMIEATKWQVKAILTDRTADYLALRTSMKDDWEKISQEPSPSLLAMNSIYSWSLINKVWSAYSLFMLTRKAGPMYSSED